MREKGEISRKFEATSLVKDRLLKKQMTLKCAWKAHAEIKRERFIKRHKGNGSATTTTAAEKKNWRSGKTNANIKTGPLVNQMAKGEEHALLELLLQAREDGDADEIARMTMRCRA